MCHHACYVQCTQEYNKSVVDNKVSHRMKMEKIEKTHNEKNISSYYATNQFTSYCPKKSATILAMHSLYKLKGL